MKTKTGHYLLDLFKCTPMTNAVKHGIENPVLLTQGHRHWQQHLLHPVWHLPPLGSVSSSSLPSVSSANSWDGFILLPFVISLQQKHQTQWNFQFLFNAVLSYQEWLAPAQTQFFTDSSMRASRRSLRRCMYVPLWRTFLTVVNLNIRNLKIKCSRKRCLFQMV